jgi:iron(III) transport system substrate-binding protein
MANGFTKATGIDVAMTRKSTGEVLAQVLAESSNPKGDIWWGGTGDPHMQAAEQDITVSYQSPLLKELQPWAIRQAEETGYRTIGVYANALGFTYNKEVVADKKMPVPACWADLIRPEYKNEIQMPNPVSSGTAYTALATLVQLLGEEPAFEYLKQLDANMSQYTKSGSAPTTAASRGESAVGIGFMALGVIQVLNNFPVEVVAPCEGTGYEIGSMSMIKNGPNPETAKKFYDWALTAKAQELGAEAKSFQAPSNLAATLPPEAPDLSKVKLIDYDFKKFGGSEERKRILTRWQTEIGNKN